MNSMAILMAGQLVIPDAGDASEDGGKLRFSRQSLGLPCLEEPGGHSPAGEIGGDALLSFTASLHSA